MQKLMCLVCERPGSASSTAVGSSNWPLGCGSYQEEEKRPGYFYKILKKVAFGQPCKYHAR
jgi:hypothetical protein